MGARPYLWLLIALMVTWAGSCRGHGRLIDPPSRASAWRFGFDTPIDYNDNEGNCGGFSHQYEEQGVSVASAAMHGMRTHARTKLGGLYATGTIVRTYSEGQVIPVSVDITANHRGYFEFRLCPNNNPSEEASQTCLSQHPLFAADGSGFQYYIGTDQGVHKVNLKLPEGLRCTQCVFQWRYVTGNNWGICENGTGQVGCGRQEEFRACADVAITGTDGQSATITSTRGGGGEESITTVTAPPRTNPTASTPSQTTTTTTTTKGTSGACKAVGVWQQVPGMDNWCITNCNHTPRYCPASHCTCG